MSEQHHYETLLIGACLQAPELVNQAGISPADLSGEHHGQIWCAMQTLMAKGVTPDLVTVSDACDAPVGLLVEAMQECYSTNPELVLTWARVIRDRARRDRLAAGLHALAVSDHDADVLLHQARELLMGIEQDAPTKQRTNRDILDARLQALDDRLSGLVSPVGLSFGVDDFDRLSYGMKPSELIVLAARPAMGKSALALQAARVNAEAGKRVAVFSLEMDVDELFDRMLCQAAKFPADYYADPAKSQSDFGVLAPAVRSLKDADLHCFDSIFHIEGIVAKCRALHQVKPVDLVVVDYLQLVGTKGRPNPNRAVEVGEYSRTLKMLAMSLGCPVLLLSQLNREVEKRPDKRPLMADLRESGSVEQDANKIVMLYRDEIYNEGSPDRGIAELILRKHRGGETGVVPVAANLRWFAFNNLARDWQQEAPRHDPFA